MLDFDKAHRMVNAWVRDFIDACNEQFGEDGEQVFVGTIGALLGRMFTLYDPEKVLEHLNAVLAKTNAPCRLIRLS
jgi:hypothetical protein